MFGGLKGINLNTFKFMLIIFSTLKSLKVGFWSLKILNWEDCKKLKKKLSINEEVLDEDIDMFNLKSNLFKWFEKFVLFNLKNSLKIKLKFSEIKGNVFFVFFLKIIVASRALLKINKYIINLF